MKVWLERFVNLEHISEVVGDVLDNDPKLTTEQHGRLLYAGITFNPYNLVRGPQPMDRGNDPGSGLDTEIKQFQTEKFNETVDQFTSSKESNQNMDALGKFADLPPSNPVQWETDSQRGKYFATAQETTNVQQQVIIIILILYLPFLKVIGVKGKDTILENHQKTSVCVKAINYPTFILHQEPREDGNRGPDHDQL